MPNFKKTDLLKHHINNTITDMVINIQDGFSEPLACCKLVACNKVVLCKSVLRRNSILIIYESLRINCGNMIKKNASTFFLDITVA